MPNFGSGSGNGSSWEPSVLYLLGLVFVEITIMGIIRAYTKHGG
jgi:hypothetical protein